MENQDEVQTMENISFNEMSPNFPDLQGENRGRTPHAGWFQTEFMPWIQSLDLKKKLCNGIELIELFLVAGKMARILTDFFDFF